MDKKKQTPEAKERSRRRRRGAVAGGITVLVIGIAVLLNVILTLVLERYPLSLDLTENSIYDLSEDTVAYLGGLDKDVAIHILATRQSLSYSYDYLDLSLIHI